MRHGGPEGEPQRIIDRLQGIHPERNIAFTAIEVLRDPAEMSKFVTEYAEWLGESEDPEVKKNPLRVACDNINYIAGYFNREAAERWMIVTESTHPVFGTAHLPYLQSDGTTPNN